MTPAERLAKAVAARRQELSLGQQALAERALTNGRRISFQTIRNVEAAAQASYRDPTLLALDAGLGWQDGTASAIFNGAPPAPAPEVEVERDELAARLARLETRMGLDDRRLGDINAMETVLGCLSDDQFEIVARAVKADGRYRTLA